MQKQQVPVELIVTDAGTQQRPLEDEVLKQYIELMQDRVEFPPVEIIREAEKYYLWDGFHRLECAKRLEKKFVYAYVKPGILNDAIWLSFGANKLHGHRRAKGITKAIIEKILCDAKWSKISQAKIAKHVGVTGGFVSQVKSELLKQEKMSSESKKPDSIVLVTKTIDEEKEPKKKVKRAKKITVTRGNSTYEQKSQERQYQPTKPISDKAGQPVPDNLRELYEGRSDILGLLHRLKKIQDEIIKAVNERNPIFTYMNMNQLRRDYKNYRRQIKAALPNYVCPYCVGKRGGCKICSGIGLLNELNYAGVIKEMKGKKE